MTSNGCSAWTRVGNARELGHERARHRDVGLRAVDRIGPVHRHRAGIQPRLASRPILRPHVHAKRRGDLLGIGDDVDVVSPRCECVGRSIGPHADSALDRREFADDANSHRRSSTRPDSARSVTNSSAPGKSSSATHCSSAPSTSNSSAVKFEDFRLAGHPCNGQIGVAFARDRAGLALEDASNVIGAPQQNDAGRGGSPVAAWPAMRLPLAILASACARACAQAFRRPPHRTGKAANRRARARVWPLENRRNCRAFSSRPMSCGGHASTNSCDKPRRDLRPAARTSWGRRRQSSPCASRARSALRDRAGAVDAVQRRVETFGCASSGRWRGRWSGIRAA